MINLDYVKEQRGLKFVKKGMKVIHTYGNKNLVGRIKSGNSSGNLNILFDGEKKPRNCHPTWALKYYDENDNLIVEYGE